MEKSAWPRFGSPGLPNFFASQQARLGPRVDRAATGSS